jgi:uncharacterized protein YndB with AHSA1/START domain
MAVRDSAATTFSTPADREVVITRVFDAPRELVFKAFTDPKLVPQWWGPAIYTTTVDKMDVRPGGAWRFISRAQDGREFAFHGVYREIVPPARLVYTFDFEGTPGHELLETVTLEEIDGKTKVTDRSVFKSIEDRDGMLKTGMQEGATESMDRLAKLLAAGEDGKHGSE